jgi:DNA-binding response OmpR family regulator
VPTALVVDDAEDLRVLMRHVLSRAGIDVVEAASGSQAIELLDQRDADIAIIDVQMPEMDGWQTVARLRARPGTAELPILLCTVKSSLEDSLRAWELGCDAYLTKPFAISDLVEEVQLVLGRSKDDRRALRATRLASARRELTERDQGVSTSRD